MTPFLQGPLQKLLKSTVGIFKHSVPYCNVQDRTAYHTVLMYRTHVPYSCFIVSITDLTRYRCRHIQATHMLFALLRTLEYTGYNNNVYVAGN